MTVREIVEAFLREHGYHGLCSHSGDCACTVDDLAPCCNSPLVDCKPGHLAPCDCSDHHWHIAQRKPEVP